MLCSKCHKNVAVIFITKLEGEKQTNEGLCLSCAKSMGIAPIEQFVGQMGIDDSDIDAISDELNNMMEGLENGADAYITKPFSINVLRANIRNILANRALLRRAYAGLEDGVGQVPPDCHNTRDWKFMASVRECVMKNIDNPGFCVDMLCGMQNMSRTGFFNKLKALTGHAPADYIRSMRLQYAAQLLREKDCSITEISDDSGFSDVRYFREVFRKYYGMSPSEYRNSMRG